MAGIRMWYNKYALGNCSTILSKADKDKPGTLTLKEFQEAMDDICVRYSQVELYLKSKAMLVFMHRLEVASTTSRCYI